MQSTRSTTTAPTQRDDSGGGFTFVTTRRRRHEESKLMGRYRHQCCQRCVDDDGRRVFSPTQLYTCEQVARQGFCSYLCEGSFQCDVPLTRSEYKLCNEHYRECLRPPRCKVADAATAANVVAAVDAVSPPSPLSSPSPIPFYLREKMNRDKEATTTTTAQQQVEKAPNKTTIEKEKDKRQQLKTLFNELFYVDAVIEREIAGEVALLCK